MKSRFSLLLAASALTWAGPALAGIGDPIEIGEDATLDPIIDLRLRYENVSQDNGAGDADALTARLRLGAELKASGFFLLAEGEGTLALSDDYNDTLPGNGVEPFSVVADPENLELNRLQVGYMDGGNGVTIGRQRIILDNARFVGNVGWRQNEQTFDAIRGQASLGPVKLDATYAISQRTIFGVDSPNAFFDGDIVLLNAGVDLAPVKLSGFAYLVDYDTRIAFSSQTYGLRATGSFPVGGGVSLNGSASFATQSDLGMNPTGYTAEYLNAEAGIAVSGISLNAGYEVLGSDDGMASFQTPLATLHAFNGWADVFLTTPAAGLQDIYFGGGYNFGASAPVPGLRFAITYHQFDSDFGSIDYGTEVDALVGFKLGPVGMLVKYANYHTDGFGVDTEKVWIQAGISF